MTIEKLNKLLLSILLPTSLIVLVFSLIHFTYFVSPMHAFLISGSYIFYNVIRSLAERTVNKQQTDAYMKMLKQYNKTNGENK